MKCADSRLVPADATRSGLAIKTECCATFCCRKSAGRQRTGAKLFEESLGAAGLTRRQIAGWICMPVAQRDSGAARQAQIKRGRRAPQFRRAARIRQHQQPHRLFRLERAWPMPCPTASGGCPHSARASVATAHFGSECRVKRIVQPELLDALRRKIRGPPLAAGFAPSNGGVEPLFMAGLWNDTWAMPRRANPTGRGDGTLLSGSQKLSAALVERAGHAP